MLYLCSQGQLVYFRMFAISGTHTGLCILA